MVINSYHSHIQVTSLETFHIGYLLCVECCQVLLTLVKRFIMLLRSRSRTHHIFVLLLHWKYAKTCLPFPPNRLLHALKCQNISLSCLVDETQEKARQNKYQQMDTSKSMKKCQPCLNRKQKERSQQKRSKSSPPNIPHTCTS